MRLTRRLLLQCSCSRFADVNDHKLRSIQDLMWRKVAEGNVIPAYLQLGKARLTGLVVVSSMAGYAMSPGAFDLLTFGACSVGVAMLSAAANGINQWLEVPFDSQMNRTKNRPIVRAVLTPLQAVTLCGASVLGGITILSLGTSPLTVALGLTNLSLYTMVYTPSKRLTMANTWIGAVVGALPPLMGWAAGTGTLHSGAFILAGVLYCWQFPHFNALSWNLRSEYSRAGYRMMSVLSPQMCRATSLRHSIFLTMLCCAAPLTDLTHWSFAIDSLPFNLYLCYLAVKFYHHGDAASSRKLFRFSLIHLPAILLLMLISKHTFNTDENDEKAESDRT